MNIKYCSPQHYIIAIIIAQLLHNYYKIERMAQKQLKHSSSSFEDNKWSLSYRKYSRITPEMKDKLIFLIVRNNMSIKQAAQYLKINYSSAKFIFSQYRDRNFQTDHLMEGDESKKCTIRRLADGEDAKVELKYTVGGKYEGETNAMITAYSLSNY